MKNISVQYQELQEGKMNQAQFLRNARMMFPSLVTNLNSFDDSVKILKTKGMLVEGDAVKGAPDKEPTYDYPTQPGKYKKVEQSPEVDEQDGIYPATTLTDIPKEKVSKPIKSKTRPDGLEDIKNNDTKNELKKVKVVKENYSKVLELPNGDYFAIDDDWEDKYQGKNGLFFTIKGNNIFDKDGKSVQSSPREFLSQFKPEEILKVKVVKENISPEALKGAEKEITKNDASIKMMADKLGISEEELFKMLLKKLGGLKEYNSYDDEPYYSDVPKSTPNKDWDTDDDVSDRYDDYEEVDENEKSFDDVLKNFLDTDNSTEIKAYLKAKGKEAIAKIKTKLPQLKDQARQKLAKLMKVELDEVRLKTEAQTQIPADTLSVTNLFNRVPMIDQKLNLINNAAELQDIFDYILDRVNPSLGASDTQLRTALNLAIKTNLDNKKAEKQAGTSPSNSIKDRLKPAITKLVQEVLDEMGQ